VQYRNLGARVTEKVSALGFGCMRFPTAGENGEIDKPQADRMLKYAIDHGVNYVDTAWPYHKGESENVVGETLSGGYRDKVLLATKMPMWEVKEASDLDRIFEEQLRKLQTDHIDFYLLHALGRDRWKTVVDVEALAWGERMKAQGKIRYLGFSFHDDYDAFIEIVDAYDKWDFCQIQHNYMNETIQAGTAGLAYAASKGIGVVIMEPLLGGGLASPPDVVRDALSGSKGGEVKTPVKQALRWLWDKEDVGTVLSGMSSMEQVVEDVQYADRSAVGCLAEPERALFKTAKKLYESLRPVPCTTCGYCMPCPHGVDIPGNFTILNDRHMFNNEGAAIWRYNTGMDEEHRASACVECGECEPKCPQQIPIIESLKMVHSELERKPEPA
jgi:uncharacterized protein